MTSPPLSPIPRRINTPSMAELLSSLEASSERDRRTRRDSSGSLDEVERALQSPTSGPEIRTTSPSPRREARAIQYNEHALSPTHTGASRRGGGVGGPRSPTTREYAYGPR
jgi:hypothetical protein